MAPALSYEDLQSVNTMWVEAPEPAGGNFDFVPDGEYLVEVTALRGDVSSTQKVMLQWEAVIIGGPEVNKHLRRNNLLDTPDHVGWCKADLRKVGVPVDDPAFDMARFVTAKTGLLIGSKQVWQVKHKTGNDGRDNQNCYVQRTATDQDIAKFSGSAPTASTAPAPGQPTQPEAENPWVKGGAGVSGGSESSSQFL